MSEERLWNVLDQSESAKESEKNFDGARTEKIKNILINWENRLFKPKIKEIRKDLYSIENKKNHPTQKIEKIEKNLSKLKKYMIMMIMNTKE